MGENVHVSVLVPGVICGGPYDDGSIGVHFPGAMGDSKTIIIQQSELRNPDQPYLGLATTDLLLAELQARAKIGGYGGYRTVDSE